MTYLAPDGNRYHSRHRYEVRGYTQLHVYCCLSCGIPLDDPERGFYRRSDSEYCSSACRSRAWRKARAE